MPSSDRSRLPGGSVARTVALFAAAIAATVPGIQDGLWWLGALVMASFALFLFVVTRIQRRRTKRGVANAWRFEGASSARGPQPAHGPFRPAGIGFNLKPVGKLRVDDSGISWRPSWAYRRAAPMRAPWSEVAELTITGVAGLGHGVRLFVVLTSGERWSFAMSNGDLLRTAVEHHRHSLGL